MKTVCVVRTLHDERELVIVGIPDPEPTYAVVSARVAGPPADSDPRVIAHGLHDPEEARRAAIEHATQVANDELARTGLGTSIDLR